MIHQMKFIMANKKPKNNLKADFVRKRALPI
jgi:hypothetical protein